MAGIRFRDAFEQNVHPVAPGQVVDELDDVELELDPLEPTNLPYFVTGYEHLVKQEALARRSDQEIAAIWQWVEAELERRIERDFRCRTYLQALTLVLLGLRLLMIIEN